MATSTKTLCPIRNVQLLHPFYYKIIFILADIHKILLAAKAMPTDIIDAKWHIQSNFSNLILSQFCIRLMGLLDHQGNFSHKTTNLGNKIGLLRVTKILN